MSRSAAPCRPVRPRTSRWVTLCLVAGAGSFIAWVAMALSREDIEATESPLVLVVVRQLEFGGRGLYGPFGGRNPLVLIHAPLYYRLAALAAWPLWRAGFDPVSAALIAGRILSALGFLSTIAAAHGLARVGGLPGRAGHWAALLVAATPVHGGLPLEVRPDILGIGLQTTGILLVLSALNGSRVAVRRLAAAFACFGVALCVKQHFVMAPLISVVLLARAWARGRIAFVSLASSVLIAMTIVGLYYGTEERMTHGGMSQSILFAAGNAESVHPSDWASAAGPLFGSQLEVRRFDRLAGCGGCCRGIDATEHRLAGIRRGGHNSHRIDGRPDGLPVRHREDEFRRAVGTWFARDDGCGDSGLRPPRKIAICRPDRCGCSGLILAVNWQSR